MKLTGGGITVYTDGHYAPARGRTRFGIVMAHALAGTVLKDKDGQPWHLIIDKNTEEITILTRRGYAVHNS